MTHNFLYKIINRTLAGLVTLLGFSNCDRIESPVEYGSPHVDYTVKGKVTDKFTGNPVEGIRVGYSPVRNSDTASWGYMSKIFTLTDANGEFKITESNDFNPSTVPVYVEDIDGEANGSYTSDTLSIDFKNAPQTGKPAGWYKGEYTATVHVELEEQPSNK
ncbi:MAG: radical SAM-associated putative lipoprotein [Prevotellaceae bacterium]|nr:radical SAM-associated putative lipoprotein [Prevotellaceae bacterium]